MRYSQPQSGPLNTTIPLRALFNAATYGQQGTVPITTTVPWQRVGTPHGVGLQGGYVSSAVFVFPDSGGAGNQQSACNTQHITFVVLSNAVQEGIASVGLSSTDGSPRSLLQNNAGTLRVFDAAIGYTNMEAAVVGKRYVFSIVYSDFAPYVTSYYLNGRFIASSNNYRSGVTWRLWLGTGFPTASVNAAILLYTGRAGVAESAAEVAAYAANPWQVIKSPQRVMLAAAAGPVNATGTLATTLANATLATSGAVTNVGSFQATLGGASMSASGQVATPPSGSLASTLAGATMAASGQITIAGVFGSSLAGCTLAAAGAVNNRGSLASTLAGASMAASGTVAPNVSGTINTTLDGATMAAYGYNGVPPVLAGVFQRLPKNPRHVQKLP